MKILNTLALTILFLVSLVVSQGFAQSATTTASGTVLAPLTVSATGLSFGNEIFPGLNEVVDRTAAGAAKFDITGEAGKEITATFTLPSTLTFDANTMPISFSATDGGHATSTTAQGTATGFDPNASLTTALFTAGELFIWLGGTVEPAATQAAGNYSGDITLDTVYTGI